MKLDERMLRLIAIGASITGNCQPCLQTNAAKALESGADQQEITEAIWVGKLVRRGAASKMDEFASSLSQSATATPDQSIEGCECQ